MPHGLGSLPSLSEEPSPPRSAAEHAAARCSGAPQPTGLCLPGRGQRRHQQKASGDAAAAHDAAGDEAGRGTTAAAAEGAAGAAAETPPAADEPPAGAAEENVLQMFKELVAGQKQMEEGLSAQLARLEKGQAQPLARSADIFEVAVRGAVQGVPRSQRGSTVITSLLQLLLMFELPGDGLGLAHAALAQVGRQLLRASSPAASLIHLFSSTAVSCFSTRRSIELQYNVAVPSCSTACCSWISAAAFRCERSALAHLRPPPSLRAALCLRCSPARCMPTALWCKRNLARLEARRCACGCLACLAPSSVLAACFTSTAGIFAHLCPPVCPPTSRPPQAATAAWSAATPTPSSEAEWLAEAALARQVGVRAGGSPRGSGGCFAIKQARHTAASQPLSGDGSTLSLWVFVTGADLSLPPSRSCSSAW